MMHKVNKSNERKQWKTSWYLHIWTCRLACSLQSRFLKVKSFWLTNFPMHDKFEMVDHLSNIPLRYRHHSHARQFFTIHMTNHCGSVIAKWTYHYRHILVLFHHFSFGRRKTCRTTSKTDFLAGAFSQISDEYWQKLSQLLCSFREQVGDVTLLVKNKNSLNLPYVNGRYDHCGSASCHR